MNTNENKGFMGSAVNCSFILADRKQDSEQVIPVLMSSAIKIDPKFASVLAMIASYNFFNPLLTSSSLEEITWLEGFTSKDVEYGFHFDDDHYFYFDNAQYFTPDQVEDAKRHAEELWLHTHDAEEVFNMFYNTEVNIEVLPSLKVNNAELYLFLTKVIESLEQSQDEDEAFLKINKAFELQG